MADFAQQVVIGLSSGSIYAGLALAIVLVYRSTGVINFAQGELATLTTFIAWTLVDHGVGYWAAFALTLLVAFAGGVALDPQTSRLAGVRVGWMVALGWGLAAVLGAVAGLFTAAALATLDPTMMRPILIYALAAAVLGGLESPAGAVLGGLVLGVTLN